jgi:hypothetical protein
MTIDCHELSNKLTTSPQSLFGIVECLGFVVPVDALRWTKVCRCTGTLDYRHRERKPEGASITEAGERSHQADSELDRNLSLSDAVFAKVITILVL